MSEEKPANFRDYRNLYDFQFKTLGENIDNLTKALESVRGDIKSDLECIKKDIVGLKIKSAIWGATAAFILSVLSHFVPLGTLPDMHIKDVQKQLIEPVNDNSH